MDLKYNVYKFALSNLSINSHYMEEKNINNGVEATSDAPKGNVFSRVYRFYINGFKHMTWGRTMWAIIGIKLFIMFAILKAFLFPNFLKKQGDTVDERTEYVSSEYERRALE